MIRSLRWRLQLWHALLLTTVLIIFGGVVYALQWETRLQQTDAELDRVAAVFNSRVRWLFPVPRAPTNWSRPPGRPPGPPRPDYAEGAADALTPANVFSARDPGGNREGRSRGGPREGTRDGSRENPRENSEDRSRDTRDSFARNPWFAPPPGLALPEETQHLFDGGDERSFYFIIWDRSGTILEKSKSVDEIPFPDLHAKDGLPERQIRTRDNRRELIQVSRFDTNLLVGRSIKPDLAAVHRAGMLLTLTGLGVLVIGLAGGWWFSSRAIRPITEMSAIAESISVKNLSTRINVPSTATELEQLASVLNRTFDRLQSAFERQGEFTADASHELRTPLSVILSHAELALARPRSPEDYQKAFQACRRASLRMKSLIDALLSLARFDSGKFEMVRQPVELDRVAHEATEMLQPLAHERSVQLTCLTQPVTVSADQDRLFQLLTNLLSNAIRYNRPDGTVTIEVTHDADTATVRVNDTGVGISSEDLPRIFDRFYRVDKARSQVEGGCGLGLAICHTIVESHGGTITATSEPGVGTTVEIRLPVGDVAKRSSLAENTETELAMTR
ncbi:MAG: HAMP domain-containing sensor histidine kinase [Planctomycetota bacterium]